MGTNFEYGYTNRSWERILNMAIQMKSLKNEDKKLVWGRILNMAIQIEAGNEF